jgi:hypothetical protein
VIENFGIKIELKDPESFLLVKETLTRVGVASNKTTTLYQSAHILHKQGEYYICHFKEMFKLDGKPSNISEEDLSRRNLIAKLLEDWGLIKVIDIEKLAMLSPMSSVKILSFKDKDTWSLVSKYTIGNKKGYNYD